MAFANVDSLIVQLSAQNPNPATPDELDLTVSDWRLAPNPIANLQPNAAQIPNPCANPLRKLFFATPLTRSHDIDCRMAVKAQQQKAAAARNGYHHNLMAYAREAEILALGKVGIIADVGPDMQGLPGRGGGSGKTSQVPVIIWQSEVIQKHRGSGTLILVVCRHRKSAELAAHRVAAQFGEETGHSVRYLTRNSQSANACETKPGILFVTIGILNNWQIECCQHPASSSSYQFPAFSHMIFDDVQERPRELESMLQFTKQYVLQRQEPPFQLLLLSASDSRHAVKELKTYFKFNTGLEVGCVVIGERHEAGDRILDLYLEDLLSEMLDSANPAHSDVRKKLDGDFDDCKRKVSDDQLRHLFKCFEADKNGVFRVNFANYRPPPLHPSLNEAACNAIAVRQREQLQRIAKIVELSKKAYSKHVLELVLKYYINPFKFNKGLYLEAFRYIHRKYDTSWAIHVIVPGLSEISEFEELLEGDKENFDTSKCVVLPLHSKQLDGAYSEHDDKASTKLMREIFAKPAKGKRKIMISTDCFDFPVDDCCIIFVIPKEYVPGYDFVSNAHKLETLPLNKAAVAKRRALIVPDESGAGVSGVCVQFWSKADAARADDVPSPEIRGSLLPMDVITAKKHCGPGDGLQDFLLNMPAHIDYQSDTKTQEMFLATFDLLRTVGGMDAKENITSLGEWMSQLSQDHQISKLLLFGCLFGLLDVALTNAAFVSCRMPFRFTTDKWLRERIQEHKRCVLSGHPEINGDQALAVHLFDEWRYLYESGRRNSASLASDYATENFLAEPLLLQVFHARKQFIQKLTQLRFIGENYHLGIAANRNLNNARLVNAVIYAAFYPNVLRCASSFSRDDEREHGTYIHLPAGRVQDGRKVEFHGTSVAASARPVFAMRMRGNFMLYRQLQQRTIAIRDSNEQPRFDQEFQLHGNRLVVYDVSQVESVFALALLSSQMNAEILPPDPAHNANASARTSTACCTTQLPHATSDGVLLRFTTFSDRKDLQNFRFTLVCDSRAKAETLLNARVWLCRSIDAILKHDPAGQHLRQQLQQGNLNSPVWKFIDAISHLFALPERTSGIHLRM